MKSEEKRLMLGKAENASPPVTPYRAPNQAAKIRDA